MKRPTTPANLDEAKVKEDSRSEVQEASPVNIDPTEKSRLLPIRPTQHSPADSLYRAHVEMGSPIGLRM